MRDGGEDTSRDQERLRGPLTAVSRRICRNSASHAASAAISTLISLILLAPGQGT